MKSSCTVGAFVCPHLASFSTFNILWSAVIKSPNYVESAIQSTHVLGLSYICLVVFLQTAQFGSFGQCMNTLWFPLGWDPMKRFLLLVSFASVSSPASSDNRGKSIFKRFIFDSCLESPSASRVEEDASYISDPSVNGKVCSRSKFLLADENSLNGTAFLFGNCYHRVRSVRCCIRLLSYFLIILEILLSATRKSNQVHCIVFSTVSTDGASSTTCTQR